MMKPTCFRTEATIAMVGVLVSASAAFCAEKTSESPVELVRQVVQSEVAASNSDVKVMFMDRKETPHGSQTKLIVETREGMAGMVVAVNGKPLTPEERQAEEARLAGLAANPEHLKRKQRTEKEDAERITRIMKA